MIKKITIFCITIMFFFVSNSYSITYTWKFSEKQGFGDGTMPDGDNYGNTNVWYYQYTTAGNTNPSQFYNLPLYLTISNGGYNAWHKTTYPEHDFYCYITAGDLAPGPNFDPVIRFVSPYDITVSFTAQLTHWSTGGSSDGQVFSVMKNANVLSTKTNPFGGTTTFNIENITLNQGDSLYFITNKNNNWGWDGVTIDNFSISGFLPDPVPEPSTVILFGLSVFNLIRKYIRKN